MKENRYFTVGPSAIYSQVPSWIQEFFIKGLASEYHRSVPIQNLYRHLIEQLSILMNIPSTHAIFISSSGSEIMERILQNCVSKSSFHFVNGAFSKKFYQFSKSINLASNSYTVSDGDGFSEIPNIPTEAELICITHNETSTGVKIEEDIIHAIKTQYPDKILAVDIVSSAPFAKLDFGLVDMAFFSSQKAFGLPSGLGIWIMNKNLAENLSAKNLSVGRGSHNTLKDYLDNYTKLQTPSTPNTLGMYLLGRVAEDINQKGIQVLNDEMMMKKKKMIEILSNNSRLKLAELLGTPSDTVIVAEYLEEKNIVLTHLHQNNIIPSLGYGNNRDIQLRFSNFPANTWEDIVYLEKILTA